MYQIKVSHHFETEPLVFDGFMYITEPPSDVTALDLRPDGRFGRIADPCQRDHRLLRAGESRISCAGRSALPGDGGRALVALDMKTGRVRWDVEVADYKRPIRSQPRRWQSRIRLSLELPEPSTAFAGSWMPTTPRPEGDWRFWTVPGPGEPGNETWSGDSWKIGGATTWVTGSYDPEANLYIGALEIRAPITSARIDKGDNLYSDSIVAWIRTPEN